MKTKFLFVLLVSLIASTGHADVLDTALEKAWENLKAPVVERSESESQVEGQKEKEEATLDMAEELQRVSGEGEQEEGAK